MTLAPTIGDAGRVVSRTRGRTVLALAVLVASLVGVGCGGTPDATRGQEGASAGDTVRTDVQGREVVIPPPEGTAEVLHLADEPSRRAAGGQMVGLFLPHELLPAVRAGRLPDSIFIGVSPGRAKRADDDFIMEGFIRLRAGAFEEARGPHTPAETTLREAFDRCLEGDCVPGPSPFGGQRPDSARVRTRSIDDRVLQELIITWNPERGRYDHTGWEFVLVNRRLVLLIWTRREAFSIAALADVSESLDRWAEAVLAANP